MPNIAKAYAITDAKISFVLLVDKAANKKQFLITKSEDGSANFATYGRILKADADSHFVTGIVYEPMVEDSQGNYMTEDEITKAAYWFAKNSNQVDLQHCFQKCDGAAVVESYVAKCDMEIEGEAIKKGTWLMTMEITDADVWDSIQKGDITGFSMGGVGVYSDEDVTLPVEKQDEPKGLFRRLAKVMGFEVVEKGAKEAPAPVVKAGKSLSSKNLSALKGIYDTLGSFLADFDEGESAATNNVQKEEIDMTKYVQIVMPNCDMDYEGVINVANSYALDDDKLTTAQACAWVAGATAGATKTDSNTCVAVSGATSVVGIKTNEEAEEAITNGEFFFIISEEDTVIVEYDINSLHTFTTEKTSDYSKNRVIRVYDSFAEDLKLNFPPNKYDNDEDGWLVMEGIGKALLQSYEDEGAITDVDADNDFYVDQSRSIGDETYFNVGLQAVDSAEKLYFSISTR